MLFRSSGFAGPVCGLLYNHSGNAKIEVGMRVAQFIIGMSDSNTSYEGKYKVKEGERPEQLEGIINHG